ncbi:transketolase C-terminal domain-containing protein [Synechococcus sp. UW140]|uniref:transketolase family protein n=1 Tax=Synechococcus sp. UW140 TaxID=368503 RepID=UPI003137EB4B
MRDAFANEMTALAAERNDLTLLSGDIGNRMFDRYKQVAPERFFNCGIAEANMMSLAAGMALSGLRPVIYTITPFTTTRCLEQIRVGVAYHQAPVVIVGTGSGLSYAELGPTHHSLEDMAILRTLPGLNVLAPADSIELVAQLKAALNDSHPTYIRIGKKGEPQLHQEGSQLGIGKANLLRDGSDLLVVGVGPILGEALKAAENLAVGGFSVAIASLGGVKPLDDTFLRSMAERFPNWLSLEEHGITGGVGSALLEWLSGQDVQPIRLKRLGVPDVFLHELGNQSYTRQQLGLDADGLVRTFRQQIEAQG